MRATTRWIQRYKSFYDAYNNELLARAVSERWQKIDLMVSLLVALTATGSTISGFGFWATAWGKPLWGILGVIASLASIVHSVARVPDRLQKQAEARREFSLLRGKLQDLLYRMDNEGDSEDLQKEYSALNNRLVELTANLDLDPAATESLRERVQDDLNLVIERLGITQGGIMVGEEETDDSQASPTEATSSNPDSEAR